MILIDIKDLYSLSFDCPASEIPYIDMVKKIDDCHDCGRTSQNINPYLFRNNKI